MDFTHLQDVFSSIPMVKRYSLLCLFFHLDDTYEILSVTQALQDGLRLLSTAIPHPKGRVVFEKRSEDDTGRVRILPHDDSILLVPKDLRDRKDVASYEEFSAREFPFSFLDSHELVPEDVLPLNFIAAGPYEDSEERPARVLVVQANFLHGGVVLAFCSCHPTMDMNGLGQTICLLAKACRGEHLTEKVINEANQSRRDAVPLLGHGYVPGEEAKYFIFRFALHQPRRTIRRHRPHGAT